MNYLESRGMEQVNVHTSGHADAPTLKQMVETLRPRQIVPIHTFAGDRYDEVFEGERILYLDDGKEVKLYAGADCRPMKRSKSPPKVIRVIQNSFFIDYQIRLCYTWYHCAFNPEAGREKSLSFFESIHSVFMKHKVRSVLVGGYALIANNQSRELKDTPDIVQLMRMNGIDPREKGIQSMFQKYGLERLYEGITSFVEEGGRE